MPATTPPRIRSFAGLLLSAALAPLGWIGVRDRRRRRQLRHSSMAMFLSVCMLLGPEQVYALNQETSIAYAMSVAGVGTIPSPQVTYDYDNNGNLIERDDGTNQDTFVYDAENRLINADINIGSASTSSYEYDVDGVRRSKTVNSVTTYHLTDKNRPYAQVIEEIDDMDVVQMRYLYGDDLISQTATSTTHYFHYDGQMSTRQLTDNNTTPSAVVVSDYYKYDAFGAITDSAGSTSNTYLYTGEQYDSDLGQYYLRARYYNPVVGRFTSRDTIVGSRFDPVTLHKYIYCNAEPLNRIDPSGQLSIASLSTSTFFQFVLRFSYLFPTVTLKTFAFRVIMGGLTAVASNLLLDYYYPAIVDGLWSLSNESAVISRKVSSAALAMANRFAATYAKQTAKNLIRPFITQQLGSVISSLKLFAAGLQLYYDVTDTIRLMENLNVVWQQQLGVRVEIEIKYLAFARALLLKELNASLNLEPLVLDQA